MQSIHSTIQNFNLTQAQKEGAFSAHFQNFLSASEKMNATADRLNNTLIKGGISTTRSLGRICFE